MPIRESVNLPNFNKMNNILELEENSLIVNLKDNLENMGHQVKVRDLTSGIHAIYIDDDILHAGIDKRREGFAKGE